MAKGSGGRGGSFEFGFGLPQHAIAIRQEAPPGGVDYLEWEDLDQISLDPSYGQGIYGGWAKVLHLGEPGYPLHAARIVFTLEKAKLLINWSSTMGPYWPADAVMSQISGAVKAYTIPQAMPVLCTLSMTPSDPGWYTGNVTDMYITRVDPPADPETMLNIGWFKSVISGQHPQALYNASDLIELNVDFVALPPVDYNPPHITETYFRGVQMQAIWSATTAADMATSTSTMSLSGEATGKAIWAMNGSGQVSLNASPDLILNAVLAGDAPLNLDGLVDASVNTTHTDNTGWGSLGLDVGVDANGILALSGTTEFTLTGEADPNMIGGLDGGFGVTLNQGSDSTIQLDGSFYTYTSFFLDFAGGLVAPVNMDASASFDLSGGSSDLIGDFVVAGGADLGFAAASSLSKTRPMDGATEFTLIAGSESIYKDVPLDGATTLDLGTWAAVTYFRPQPAAPDRTFAYARTDREIEVSRRERTRVVEASGRVIDMEARYRVIPVRQQQEGK